jgi:hypothetical protein
MLPVGHGQGQLWKGDEFLCDVDYEISEPLTFVSVAGTQHVKMLVHNYECEDLLHVAGLTLVLADGSRHRLPRPIDVVQGDGRLECFLNTDVPS